MRSVSALVLLAILGTVIIGPYLVPLDPMRTDPASQLQPPSFQHLLGTDLLGRDVFSRVLHGGRLTLLIAALATLLAVSAGLLIGGIAGLWPERIGSLLIFGVHALLAVPGLVIALVVVTLMGRGSGSSIVALGIAQIAPVAYMTRTTVLGVRSEIYIDAALSLGAAPFHILSQHVLPNIQPVILSYAGVVFSYMILNGAALSFLGVGNEPGIPDWGVMLAEGRAAFRTAPWIGIAPGAAITLLVWTVNDLAGRITTRK
jgi:peptide/nickel transport system permease protein